MLNLNKLIESLRNGDLITENEVKTLCKQAKELFLEE